MFQSIRNFSSKVYAKIAAGGNALYSQALLGSIIAVNTLNGGGGLNMDTIGCTIQDLAYKVAFYGAIVGLMLYGVYKVISIVNPQLAGSVSNYLKDVVYGLIIVAAAGAVVGFLGNILFGDQVGGALCGG